MIAQRIPINNVVAPSDEATVQAAIAFFNKRPTMLTYRWMCDTCGMIYTGSAPASCECCGKEVSLASMPDFPREMNSHW